MDEMEWLEIFGTNLSEILADYGITQKDLAEDSGLSEATISAYINKHKMPGVKAIINISYALGMDPTELIDFGERIY